MKEHYKWSTLHIAYYHQRDSKNQLLATFIELLVHSSRSAESQQWMLKHFVQSIKKSYHQDFPQVVVSK